MYLFIFNTSFANTDGNISQINSYSLIITLIFFSLIFYFISFRPQQKRNQAHKELIYSIRDGDEILINSGIVCKVVKVLTDDFISIKINDNNEIIIKREFVSVILPKGTIKSILESKLN